MRMLVWERVIVVVAGVSWLNNRSIHGCLIIGGAQWDNPRETLFNVGRIHLDATSWVPTSKGLVCGMWARTAFQLWCDLYDIFRLQFKIISLYILTLWKIINSPILLFSFPFATSCDKILFKVIIDCSIHILYWNISL